MKHAAIDPRRGEAAPSRQTGPRDRRRSDTSGRRRRAAGRRAPTPRTTRPAHQPLAPAPPDDRATPPPPPRSARTCAKRPRLAQLKAKKEIDAGKDEAGAQHQQRRRQEATSSRATTACHRRARGAPRSRPRSGRRRRRARACRALGVAGRSRGSRMMLVADRGRTRPPILSSSAAATVGRATRQPTACADVEWSTKAAGCPEPACYPLRIMSRVAERAERGPVAHDAPRPGAEDCRRHRQAGPAPALLRAGSTSRAGPSPSTGARSTSSSTPDGATVCPSAPRLPRPDVHALFPRVRNAATCGFRVRLDSDQLPDRSRRAGDQGGRPGPAGSAQVIGTSLHRTPRPSRGGLHSHRLRAGVGLRRRSR